MNKKRLLIFIIVCLILSTAIYLITKKNKSSVFITTENTTEGVKLFYYRSVPGLKRAEDAQLVVPIHKSFNLPGTDYNLKIDRIWYNKKHIHLFYHVENIDKPAYLGGQFYLPGNIPSYNTGTDVINNIGRPSEKGVFYNGGFYSCISVPALTDFNGQPIKTIEQLCFKPSLTVDGASTGFNPFVIEINYFMEDEPIEKFEVDSTLNIENGLLKFYRIDVGFSFNRIYFSYTPNDRLERVIYRLDGILSTDKGEKQTLSLIPKTIEGPPYNYYFETAPFDNIPKTINIRINSIDMIGRDKFSCKVNTSDVKKKKGSHIIRRGVGQVMDTNILLESIKLDEEVVRVDFLYIPPKDLEPPYTYLKAHMPIPEPVAMVLSQMDGSKRPVPNIVTVKNNSFQNIEHILQTNFGSNYGPGERMSFTIPRRLWDDSDTIMVTVSNLTIRIEADKSVNMNLIR